MPMENCSSTSPPSVSRLTTNPQATPSISIEPSTGRPTPEELVQSAADEMHQLKAAVTDLQSKRLSALSLYHEEKARRQQESSRISQLTIHFSSLQQQLIEYKSKIEQLQSQLQKQHLQLQQAQQQAQSRSLPHFESTQSPSLTQPQSSLAISTSNKPSYFRNANRTRTDASKSKLIGKTHVPSEPYIGQNTVYSAHQAQIGILPTITPPSLTWHSLSMTDQLTEFGHNSILVMYSLSDRPKDKSNSDSEASTKSLSTPPHPNATVSNQDKQLEEVSATLENVKLAAESESKRLSGEVCQLKEKLNQKERDHEDTKQQLVNSQKLMQRMEQLLASSNNACKELVESIHLQEKDIPKLL